MASQPVEIAVPFRVDATGSIAQVAGVVPSIEQHVETLIRTALGERLMLPNYGSDAPHAVFDLNDPVRQQQVLSTIQRGLGAWEPAVRIDNMRITNDPTNPAAAVFVIQYHIESTNVSSTATVQVGGQLQLPAQGLGS